MTTLDITIDTGLDQKVDTLGRIAAIEVRIKELQKQRDALRTQAVTEGHATWNNDGPLSNKAPSMEWWKEHRAKSFDRLCWASQNSDHPDHKAFWKKPQKLFKPA